jgi:cation/acetate symporter
MSVVAAPLSHSLGGLFFIAFLGLTIGMTLIAARRSRGRSAFYTAGGIPAWQNGLAIAGDYISAAAFLGAPALVYLAGYDSLYLALGSSVGWLLMLVFVADRLRNLGRFTFVDVLSYRLEAPAVRVLGAIATLVIVILYMMVQLVGAGKLIETGFGVPYPLAVGLIAGLMIIYVSVGGMLGITWIQAVKAVLMTICTVVLTVLVLRQFNYDAAALFKRAGMLHPLKGASFASTGLAQGPWNSLSLGLATGFSLLGMPHILMRFFTVRDARAARTSAVYAAGLLILFSVLLTFVGYGAVALLPGNEAFFDSNHQVRGGANMVSLHLSALLGGDVFLGFASAVVFATIVAAMAGLMIAGTSAVAHDLLGSRGDTTAARRLTVIGLAIVAFLLALAFRDQNLLFLVALTNTVAVSVNAPLLILVMYWGGLTSRGALWGGGVGLASSLLLVTLGPMVWVAVLGHAEPISPMGYPALITALFAIFTAILVSRFDQSQRASADRAAFPAQLSRSLSGVGISTETVH